MIEESYVNNIDENFVQNNKIKLIKLTTKITKQNEVNIIKIFSDIRLSKKTPFSKLILDDHKSSYYKLFKDSV